jgi:hypothetical protein
MYFETKIVLMPHDFAFIIKPLIFLYYQYTLFLTTYKYYRACIPSLRWR